MTAAENRSRKPGKIHPGIADGIETLLSFASALAKYRDRCERRALFSVSPPRDDPHTAHQRLEQGRYLLRPCGGAFRHAETMETAADLIALLRSHFPDHQQEVAHLEREITSGRLDILKFLTLSYCNQGSEIRVLMRQHDLDEAVATFFAVFFARPWRERAARLLTEGIDLSVWRCGYCPVCGHWASLGHIESENGHRTLWCLHCTTRWTFPRVCCAFCLTHDHDVLEILLPEGDEVYRVQACRACRRYIKEWRSENIPDCERFDAVYLGTPSLDAAAQAEGYILESNLTVRYDDPDGNELLLYRQRPLPDHCRGRRDGSDGDGKDEKPPLHTITSSEE